MTDKPKENSKLIRVAIAIFLVLAVLKFGFSFVAEKFESENVYSLSDLKHDDSTYNYVKERCESGAFSASSANCLNMRSSR